MAPKISQMFYNNITSLKNFNKSRNHLKFCGKCKKRFVFSVFEASISFLHNPGHNLVSDVNETRSDV